MDAHIYRALGLTDDEFGLITSILEREPNYLELAMYSVMWSEHCSYKSSKVHLKRLPTEAPWVLVGPGENAGVIDAGDGIAVALRIESHNHPSAIEPYQGAATGAGGILRDIFTMGARPIAVMDPIRFGPLDEARSRWIFEGVVSGISGYGNAVGVPTVGGETVFDETYTDNPLVNVLCMGVMPKDRLVLGQATGDGNLAVLLGSSTGRDGIGGVSVLASAGFGDAEAEASKRPSVQVGDPFEEKRLIEACLALLDEKLAVGIQDLGGAGIVCATSETASRGGMGMDVNLKAIPLREPAMEPYEIMTSESQERMLAIVTPANLDRVLALCEKWEVRASVVGKVTTTKQLRILDGWDGAVLADIPASSLHDAAPLYERPLAPPVDLEARRADDAATLSPPKDAAEDLMSMLADTSWVSSQYDHQLFLNTVVGPGSDASVLRLRAPGLPGQSERAVALSTDGNNRWCAIDPRQGTALVVAESTLNVACAGAKPMALVNNLNFGNPEHPEVMWQLSEAVDGMSEACVALNTPVIGGNVSLYNESQQRDIDPTPIVGVLGLIEKLDRKPPTVSLVDGGTLLMLGLTQSNLNGSRWAKEQRNHVAGTLPSLDYELHNRLISLLGALIGDGVVDGIHDIADGGIGVALAEMAVRSSIGFDVDSVVDHVELFSESPSRVIICTPNPNAVVRAAEESNVPVTELGRAGGNRLRIDGLVDIPLDVATDRWRNAIPNAMNPTA